MQPSPILVPVATLILWTFVMCFWLYATRIPAIRRNNVVYNPTQLPEAFHAQLPPAVRWKADNYNHLMEQPTLFYAITIILAVLDAGTGLNVALAWAYVGLRIVHSLVQATTNIIMLRFAVFSVSTLVLFALALRMAARVF